MMIASFNWLRDVPPDYLIGQEQITCLVHIALAIPDQFLAEPKKTAAEITGPEQFKSSE